MEAISVHAALARLNTPGFEVDLNSVLQGLSVFSDAEANAGVEAYYDCCEEFCDEDLYPEDDIAEEQVVDASASLKLMAILME